MKPHVYVNRFIKKKKPYRLEGGRQYFSWIVYELMKNVQFTNNNKHVNINHIFGGFKDAYGHKDFTKPSFLSLTMSPPDSLRKHIPRSVIIKLYMKKFNKVFVVSSYQKRYLERNGLKNVEKLGVFVDHGYFRPIKQKKDQKFTVGFAGSLNKQKGANELYRTIKQLENEDIVFVLALRSIDDNTKALHKKLMKMKNVRIVRNIDIIKFYNSVDLMFLPFVTVYGTFPIPYSLLESMSCGRPVLTTDIEPLKEVVKNGKNGFLCNKNQFAEKIKQLQKKKLDTVGKNARKYIIKNHDKKLMIEKLMKIYQRFSK